MSQDNYWEYVKFIDEFYKKNNRVPYSSEFNFVNEMRRKYYEELFAVELAEKLREELVKNDFYKVNVKEAESLKLKYDRLAEKFEKFKKKHPFSNRYCVKDLSPRDNCGHAVSDGSYHSNGYHTFVCDYSVYFSDLL